MTYDINVKDKYFSDFLQHTLDKLAWVCEKNQNSIPYTVTEDGSYNNLDYVNDDYMDGGINWWTNGFFGGLLWQMYKMTGEEKYRDYAKIQEEKLDKCFNIFEGLHHDVGFMWLLTAVADYKVTNHKQARTTALHAATILAGRFNINGRYIRAWNYCGGDQSGKAIIDCLMNLSLLYWAAEEFKDGRFSAIAMEHTDMALKYFVREDGSVNHIVEFDPNSGKMITTHGGQGYAQGSCWTRGQSWAIYGFTNGYRHTHKKAYLDAAIKTADYFIEHLPDSYIVPVDFKQPSEPALEDNSAACIAASGMLELADCLLKEEGQKYFEAACKILRTVCENRVCLDHSMDALVMKCSVAYHFDTHVQTLIYADYYLLEALMKLNGNALMVW